MATFTPKGLILPIPPTILIENLLPDPHLRDSAWNQNGATGTITDVLVGGPNGNGYTEFDMDTANLGSPMNTQLNVPTGVNAIPCVPGETYNVSCWAYRSTPDGAESQRFGVIWYNAAGGTITNFNTANVTTVQNVFTRVNIDVVAPALAVFMKPQFVWSGTYPGGTILRASDGQVTEGPGVKNFVTRIVTDDDGDPVDIGVINANMDRTSLLGIGARPLLSSEHPALDSIDDSPGTIILETDKNGILARRRGDSFGSFNLDANYRSVAPGNWAEWNTNNIFTWLSGDNNYKHARVTMLGRLVMVHIEAQIGAGGSVTGSMLPVQLPTNRDVAVESGYGGDDITAGPWPIGTAVAFIGGTIYTGHILLNLGQPVVSDMPATGTTFGDRWDANTPAVWGVGDGVCFDYTYWGT